MVPLLELRDLSKHFSGHRAVDRVTLEIPRGSFSSLLGPSGCGKTTTLRLIGGFEEPTAGEVRLNGRTINGLKPYERDVSTVFQNYALFPHLTVRENVAFGLRRTAVPDADRRASDALKLVQLQGLEARYPSQISGGERQRVALARSLVLEPQVLLLDEPLAALDPNLRKQMRAELKNLQRQVGVAFLFVTHDQEEALSLSDRIAVMNNGRIEQAGTPQEVYLRPRTRFVAGFLGTVNWIDGIGVRPETTRLSRAAPDGKGGARTGTVVSSIFLGNCFHVEVRLAPGVSVLAEVPRPAGPYAAGESVYVWWNPSDELTFPDGSQ
jgi:ABC-type Fe3+/spermidine/putrescine transport system ATPase subunit